MSFFNKEIWKQVQVQVHESRSCSDIFDISNFNHVTKMEKIHDLVSWAKLTDHPVFN